MFICIAQYVASKLEYRASMLSLFVLLEGNVASCIYTWGSPILMYPRQTLVSNLKLDFILACKKGSCPITYLFLYREAEPSLTMAIIFLITYSLMLTTASKMIGANFR